MFQQTAMRMTSSTIAERTRRRSNKAHHRSSFLTISFLPRLPVIAHHRTLTTEIHKWPKINGLSKPKCKSINRSLLSVTSRWIQPRLWCRSTFETRMKWKSTKHILVNQHYLWFVLFTIVIRLELGPMSGQSSTTFANKMHYILRSRSTHIALSSNYAQFNHPNDERRTEKWPNSLAECARWMTRLLGPDEISDEKW